MDDEPSMREMLRIMLKTEGCDAEIVPRGEDAIANLEAGERYSIVLTDLKMPGVSGLDVLRAVKRHDPACQVILMTAFASAETALEALREGAYDYMIKPFKRDQAVSVVRRALEKFSLLRENFYLREALEGKHSLGKIIGKSEAMRRVFQMIERVAPTPSTILITGESGTGKELVAQAVHEKSDVSSGPFIPINCGAIPENLIESELFGHKKGAFTGAVADKQGMFAAASGGTIFLDEVGELPLSTQVNFLRVLQEKKVKPVGSAREIPVDCRIIAATNRDLREEISEGRFREDLFYRLNIIPIELPALRERDGDVKLLLEHYVKKYSGSLNSPVRGIDAEAMKILLNYSYPGNVRELQNIIERAVTLETRDLISTDVLPFQLQDEPFTRATEEIEIPEEGIDLESMVAKLEITLIEKALERTNGVRKEAAELLGISFRSMRYRLDKYGINPDD
ncbi:MAG: sigma-54 dependent transcriptional regulator [Myxococcota bacterium]|nr:sigma-54 dependent transcriptional regulator [Myxococcota bacterium]